MPISLTTIEPAAFYNNQLPDDQAFIYARNVDGTEDKTKIVSYGGANGDIVVVPDGVVTITPTCFAGYNIKNLIIPASVATMGTSAIEFNRKVTIKRKTSLNEFINSELAGWGFVDEIIFEP